MSISFWSRDGEEGGGSKILELSSVPWDLEGLIDRSIAGSTDRSVSSLG